MSPSAVRARQTGTCRAKIRQLWYVLLFFCIPITSFFLLFAHSYLLVPVRLNAVVSHPARHSGRSSKSAWWTRTSFLPFTSEQEVTEEAGTASGALLAGDTLAPGVVVAAAAAHGKRLVKRVSCREKSVGTKDMSAHVKDVTSLKPPRKALREGGREGRNYTGSRDGTRSLQFLQKERLPGRDSPRSSDSAHPYPVGHPQGQRQGRPLAGQPLLLLESDREAAHPVHRKTASYLPDVYKHIFLNGTDNVKQVRVTDGTKIASIESTNDALNDAVRKADATENAPVTRTDDAQNAPVNKQDDAQNAPVNKQDDAQNAPVNKQDDAQNAPVKKQDDAQNTPVKKTDNAQYTTVNKQDDALNAPVNKLDDAQNAPANISDDAQNDPVNRTDDAENVPVKRTDDTQNAPVKRTDDTQNAPVQRTDDSQNTHAKRTEDTRNAPVTRTDYVQNALVNRTDKAQVATPRRTCDSKITLSYEQSNVADKTAPPNKPDADQTADAIDGHEPHVEPNPRLPLVLRLGGLGDGGNNSQRVDWVLKNLQDVPPDEYLSPHQEFFVASARNSHRGILSNVPGTVLDCGRRCCPESDVPFLLIIVPSVADHFGERRTIRNTWASPLYSKHPWPRRHPADSGGGAEGAREGRVGKGGGGDLVLELLVKVVFFLGIKKGRKYTPEKLKRESDQFGDIVLADFTDSYRNLSLKMVTALNWTSARCPRAGHVMKVDEDTFVELALTVDVLRALSSRRPPLTRFVLGHQHHSHKPPVIRRGKWEVDRRVYPFQAFPRYLVGHSYLISGDAVPDLARVAQCMPLVPNEDALLTGVLAKAAGVRRIHSPSFAYTKPRQDPCQLVDGRSISQTGFKPAKRLLDMWLKVQRGPSGNCSATVVLT